MAKHFKTRSLGGGSSVRTLPRGSSLWRGPIDTNQRKPIESKPVAKSTELVRGDAPTTGETDVTFYWAYGSNLNVRQMARRCPRAKNAGLFYVTGARLVFRGVADVVVEDGAICPGGLWKITKECERELDAYEGVGSGLYLKKYFKIRRNKHVYKCLFYQMRNERGVVPPGQSYLDSIVQGYRDFNLDLDYLDVAVQESWGNKKMTERLRQRQAKRGETNMVRDLYAST